jgi:hypothetical protein
MTLGDIASSVSAVFAGVSALVAAAAIYFPWRIQQSQELLNQAARSLERAYEALTNGGTNASPPLPNRLNWLTSARHLRRYELLKARLKTDLHRILCEEHEEYWRHRFYLCLRLPSIQPRSYFEGGPGGGMDGAQIDAKSAVVVYSFARWPQGRSDPLDSVDIRALYREYDPLRGQPGLRDYVNSFAQYRDET